MIVPDSSSRFLSPVGRTSVPFSAPGAPALVVCAGPPGAGAASVEQTCDGFAVGTHTHLRERAIGTMAGGRSGYLLVRRHVLWLAGPRPDLAGKGLRFFWQMAFHGVALQTAADASNQTIGGCRSDCIKK